MKRMLAALLCLALTAGGAWAKELKPWTGGAAPPLRLAGLDGRMHDLQDYRGKVVLLNFWATWCPPCREEMPSMARLKDKLAGQPFAVLAVDVGESEQEVRDFLGRMKHDFVALLDRDSKAVREWKAHALPVSFVIDPQGNIRYALVGALHWDDPQVVQTLSALLPPAQRQAER